MGKYILPKGIHGKTVIRKTAYRTAYTTESSGAAEGETYVRKQRSRGGRFAKIG